MLFVEDFFYFEKSGVEKMYKQSLRTIIKKIDGDLLTPILIFQRLQGKKKFLLESSAKHETSGRYSFIGANPRKTYKGAGSNLLEISHLTNTTYSYEGDLVLLLKQVMPRISNQADIPFTGGAVGYIRFNREYGMIPAVHFQIYETIIIFDHIEQEVTFIYTNIDAEAKETNLNDLIAQITAPNDHNKLSCEVTTFTELLSIDSFKKNVQKIQQQMNEGLTEIVLARKQKATIKGNPFEYYRALRIQNPSPYMYYIEFDDHIILGTSNDSIVSVAKGKVTTTTGGIEDISIKSSIQKSDSQAIADFAPSLHAIDALTHLLPADQVTGNLKETALQVISEVEQEERNLFGGAIGYIGFNGQIDFALANDALLIKDEFIYREIGTVVYPNSNYAKLYKGDEN